MEDDMYLRRWGGTTEEITCCDLNERFQHYHGLQILQSSIEHGTCPLKATEVKLINKPDSTSSISLQYLSLHLPLNHSHTDTHSSNSIGSRKETPEWGIKLLHCKVQLLVWLLVPMKLSVMVITSHLVLSWIAEWLKSEALQLAAGFYMLSVSSIRPHLSHEGHWVSTVL